jgi:glutathione S-transferase
LAGTPRAHLRAESSYLAAVLTVHHLDRSRSHRVLWLLEELGVPYEIVRYARDPVTMLAPPSLAKVHPLGKSPVITDGETTVAESAAILEYLAETHGGGAWVPAPGTPENRRCRYFLHYAEGSLMPLLLVKLIASRISGSKVPFFLRPVTRGIAKQINRGFTDPNLERHLAFLEAELTDRTWLCGAQPTIADIQMSYPVEAAVARGGAGAMPNLSAYLERMRARPAFARALAKGGPVMPD